MPFWEIYNMNIGDSVWFMEIDSNVLRVPGGWLFRSPDHNDGDRVIWKSQVFVPIVSELVKYVSAQEALAEYYKDVTCTNDIGDFTGWLSECVSKKIG